MLAVAPERDEHKAAWAPVDELASQPGATRISSPDDS
jgi:hypothetical protein